MRPNKVINLSVFDDFNYFIPKETESKPPSKVQKALLQNPTMQKVYEKLTHKANKEASKPQEVEKPLNITIKKPKEVKKEVKPTPPPPVKKEKPIIKEVEIKPKPVKVDVVVIKKLDKDLQRFEASLKQVSDTLLEILIKFFREDNHQKLHNLFVVPSSFGHQEMLTAYLRQIYWLHSISIKSSKFSKLIPAPNHLIETKLKFEDSLIAQYAQEWSQG